MTVTLPRRAARRDEAPPVDLAEHGIHRDPVNHDPLGSATFSQRLVQRAAGLFNKGTTRRSFLTRTAVLGSALAVGPIDFILKPGSAYAYTCGTCSDGWTAFCCTINSGKNSCPPNSFVAGWWKADNAAYCCGAARYIIDCNATCPTQCACRCAGGSCDGRRTCCNQFRYGQCHTEIACYGPVVCRVATCTPPWRYDPSCTTSSATDNKTVNHGAPCLTTDCGTPISKKYDALGGASGFLGAPTAAERANSDKRGRMRTYQGGNIYWTSTTGAHEVHGAILTEFGKQAGV
ncbi:MAG: LGFP repeat-containing protein, partial [Aquihabitans sp.]